MTINPTKIRDNYAALATARPRLLLLLAGECEIGQKEGSPKESFRNCKLSKSEKQNCEGKKPTHVSDLVLILVYRFPRFILFRPDSAESVFPRGVWHNTKKLVFLQVTPA